MDNQTVLLTPAKTHNHATDDQIDGSMHPELIPNIAAYRLFFLAVGLTANPSAGEKTMQSAQLQQLGFEGKDSEGFTRVLQTFRAKYNDLVNTYNAKVPAQATGFAPDVDSFLSERDALVQNTLDELKVELSPAAFNRLGAYVNVEKTRMKISTGNQRSSTNK
ncbi:MAG TPA: hypothetical protein VKW78_06630 [Terriglobales bacterium]|nr:hypothetical protein [Terriglobales bacterium]